VKYKVLVKKCTEPERAGDIAEVVAQWSGSKAVVVAAALMQNSICIKKEAEEQEALKLKKMFEAAGAAVELEKIPEPAAPPPSPPPRPVAQPVAASRPSAAPPQQAKAKTAPAGDDDDDEISGRILTEQEYLAKLNARSDIFFVEHDTRARNIEVVSVLVGVALSVWLSTLQLVDVATDFYEKLPDERIAKIVNLPSTLNPEEKKLQDEKKKAEEEIKTDKKTLAKTKRAGAGGNTGGGGDPRARVTRKGVLGIISGQIKGKTVASADIFGKGGFATGIDAILQGVGGLSAGGGGGVGRRGAAGIGYGAGYGSGFGGGGGGVDDLISGLMGGEGGSLDLSPKLKQHKSIDVAEPRFVQGGALTGGRSMAEIRRVVMQNLAALRYAYNKRLRDKPGLKGKITVKFAIDEFGNVIYCQSIQSTMGDKDLEDEIVGKIKRWAFGKIDKPGDVTEVIYPFVFSQ
jgi:hypothetical protein